MGVGGVRIVEQESLPGAGSTSRANGGIRAQFTTDVNIAMSLASMEILDGLASEMGDPPLYRKAGYLFFTGDASKLRAMTAAAKFQRARGVSVEVLDEAGVRSRASWIAGAVAGGTFGPRDGFVDPGRLTNFFLREATRAGVQIRYGAGVSAIERDGSAFRLRTGAGDLLAQIVVNAAGPSAKQVAAMVNVKLPVDPVRRHILISGPCASLPPVIPMVIDADSGVLVRREGAPPPPHRGPCPPAPPRPPGGDGGGRGVRGPRGGPPPPLLFPNPSRAPRLHPAFPPEFPRAPRGPARPRFPRRICGGNRPA